MSHPKTAVPRGVVVVGSAWIEWVMQIVPVIDLAQGAAVLARGGDRSRYAPVRSVLTPGRTGDPLALVQAYRDILGAGECYLADLDAIQGGAPQHRRLREIADSAAPARLLVDAGVGDPEFARETVAAGAARVVVGLETLPAFDRLGSVVATIGPERVVFSLDLRHGSPLAHPANAEAHRAGADPIALAARAVAAGVATLLLLDLARVGTGGGVDLGLLAVLRRRFPSARLLAGGGIGGRRDLDRLRDAGCDGALVATAFHTGRIGPDDLAALAAPVPAQSSASTSRQVADCP
jgi:phosphoribosylformimino-5-aminoimidazole carboxamide ribotide isomerase